MKAPPGLKAAELQVLSLNAGWPGLLPFQPGCAVSSQAAKGAVPWPFVVYTCPPLGWTGVRTPVTTSRSPTLARS